MESLSETPWDVVIAGTGLLQALLALSLSRSGKKVLHVDRNEYYGGRDAALSLNEAEQWAQHINSTDEADAVFSNVKIASTSSNSESPPAAKLGASRSYTLSLSPQLIYAQSKLLPALVSSRVHTQLEFQAVGSWWVQKNEKIQRIPSGREDIFADDSLSVRDKRALMKFLRSVIQEPDEDASKAEIVDHDAGSLSSMLSAKFKISDALHLPLLALSLSPLSASSTESSFALPRIQRHMRSIGAFGPGFGAVIPKYGGNSEIAQVGCRASAVGGGVYVLGTRLSSVYLLETDGTSTEQRKLKIDLSNGEHVKSSYFVGAVEDLQDIDFTSEDSSRIKISQTSHIISIVTAPLSHLFPPTSENGPVPAGAVILFDDSDGGGGETEDVPPVYLQAHSEDTGECPNGQCVIYGSTLTTESSNEEASRLRLQTAVDRLIVTNVGDLASVIWSMSYTSKAQSMDNSAQTHFLKDSSGRMMAFVPRREDIAFDDSLLDSVKAVYEKILEAEAESAEFMTFEERVDLEEQDDM